MKSRFVWTLFLGVTLGWLGASARSRQGAEGQLASSAVPFAPGVISSSSSYTAAFSPDGRTFYFARLQPVIMASHLENGRWGAAAPVSFSTGQGDGDPAVAPDGSRVFFFSWRPARGKPAGGAPIPDLWSVKKDGGAFGEAVPVGASSSGEWTDAALSMGGPSAAADGTLYCFKGTNPAKDGRLMRARPSGGRYARFEDLGSPLNDFPSWDPYVAPDQRYMIFASNRPDAAGRGDLYVSFREPETDTWSEPRNLGPTVNSATMEYGATVSPDGTVLVFTRSGQGIFRIDTAALNLPLSTRR